METITFKILLFLLAIFILIVVANQILLFVNDEYDTETAFSYSSAEKITFNGIYVRDESVVLADTNGVLSYQNEDGSKIAKNSVVAYVYKNESDIFINQQIEKLKAEAELLEREQNPGTTDVAQPEFISGLIEEKYQTVTSLIAKNDLAVLAEERRNFQSLLGIYQIVVKKETDYNDRIDALNKEIAALEKKRSEPIDEITVSDSGYFVSYVDGYESILSTDSVEEITAQQIKEIVENDGYNSGRVSKSAVGKLISGYKWNIVGLADIDDAVFNLGDEVKVKLASTPDTVTAKIENIIKTDEPTESIVVLSCEKLNYNLVQYRTERMEIILNDFTGIKVPRSAIRFNKQNEIGVYILQGQRVSFKKLDVIFECDEYMLSKETADSDYVSLYDDVIIKGEISPEILNKTEETTAETEYTDVPETTAGTSEESQSKETEGTSGDDDNE